MLVLRTLYARYRLRWFPAFAGMTLILASSVHAQSIDPALCRNLVQATPRADVAYQAGVDVHGNAVAPADLPGSASALQVPTKFDIPLTASLARTLHLNTAQYPTSTLGEGTEAYLGTLTVDGTKTYFNGQPLSDAQQDNLAVLCMKPTH